MRIMCVVGARPNFIKAKPLVSGLRRRGSDPILVHTGQHYDPEMSSNLLIELGLPEPDHHLGVGSGSHAEQTGRIMMAFEALVGEIRPACVIVFGDVNSTLACALVTAKAGVSLAHVEAGLRSGDLSMPEEINRIVTDRLSDLMFAPSADAVANLMREGRPEEGVHLVGNIMVDTLLTYVDEARDRETARGLGIVGDYGLVTLHRPSNVDDPRVLQGIATGLKKIAEDLPLILPAHPRSREAITSVLGDNNIIVTGPMGYLDFLSLQAGARLILTDSGGIQEESTVLGVPCLTLRDTTERPITVTEGTNQVVGTDGLAIVSAAKAALAGTFHPRRPPLWDGRTAERIADVLLSDPVLTPG